MTQPAYKRCSMCGEVKPLDGFYRKPRRSDGRDSRCKACHNAYVEKRRDPEQVRERKRAYDRGRPEALRRKGNAYRAKHPEKVHAGHVLRRAVREGRIVRPNECEACDASGLVHAHHPDYSKPLEVRWLCPRCHSAEHRSAALSPQEDE
jgi:ribosomal protein S27AE